MELADILKLLYDHQGRVQSKYDAIADGTVTYDVDPSTLYYLSGILDQINVEIEVFETVIKGNAETMIKANELLSRIEVSRGVKK